MFIAEFFQHKNYIQLVYKNVSSKHRNLVIGLVLQKKYSKLAKALNGRLFCKNNYKKQQFDQNTA